MSSGAAASQKKRRRRTERKNEKKGGDMRQFQFLPSQPITTSMERELREGETREKTP